MKLILSFLILLSSSLGWAHEVQSCRASSGSCEFYQCLEQKHQCGGQGYLQKFGYPQCQKYLNMQKFSSRGLQRWYPKVRECLQKQLARVSEDVTCQQLGDFAFQSHVPCYIQTGFCDLSATDYLEYVTIVGSALWLPEVQQAGQQVSVLCAQKKSQLETF